MADESSAIAFQTLFGIEPEVEEFRGNRTIHRRLSQIDSHRVELIEQPGRVDAFWMSPNALEAISADANPESASIGSIDKVSEISHQARKLCALVTSPVRVACGGTLFLQANSPGESYKVIQSLIPEMEIDYDKVTDFLLQRNRFKNFNCLPNLRLNRLSVINSIRPAVLNLAVPFSAQTTVLGSAFTQITVDISSDVSSQNVITEQDFSNMWPEMVEAFSFMASAA